MQQVALSEVIGHVQELLQAGQFDKVSQALVPALNQFPNNPALWFFAGYYFHRTGQHAFAAEAWRRSFDLEPQAQVLANLGAVMRDTQRTDDARRLLKRAMMLMDLADTEADPTIANYLGTFVNEGMAEEALREAAKLPIRSGQSRFNLALLNLEAGNFGEGFRLYAGGRHEARHERIYEGARKLTAQNFEDARGHRLIVYGEQGIGDELMFATMFRDAVKDFDIIFDHHPRLEELYESAPWANQVERHATRKATPDWYKPGDAAYCAPIADLAQFYRDTPEKFAWQGPVYKADPDEVAIDRKHLEALANGRKIIGLSVRGGSLKTNLQYRSVGADVVGPLLERDDLMFVVLDYDDVTDVMSYVLEKHGPGKLYWFPSITWAWDYARKAALVAATDAVVTVCQSVAHLSAAMGHPTHVMVPAKPAWRYGVRPGIKTPWFWYPGPHAALYRQQGTDWTPAIEELSKCLT